MSGAGGGRLAAAVRAGRVAAAVAVLATAEAAVAAVAAGPALEDDAAPPTATIAPSSAEPRLGADAAPAVAAPARPLWELGLGVTALRLPHYRGAGDASTWLLPVPWVVYRGDWLRADRDGARVRLFDTDRLELDLGLAAGAPAQSDEDDARRGMDDLETTVEVGPRLRIALDRSPGRTTELRLPLRAVIGLDGSPSLLGWTAAPVLVVEARRAGVNWAAQAGPVWGDAKLHRRYYGVGAGDVRPGRPAYAASGGFGGWQVTASASREWGDWWLAGFVRVDGVGGATFADSPLVRQRTNVGVGIALVRVLARSSRTAAD